MMFVVPSGGYGPRFGTVAGSGLGPGVAGGEPRDALIRFGDVFTATAFSDLYESAARFGWIGPAVTINDATAPLKLADAVPALTYRLLLDPVIDPANPNAMQVVVGVEWRTPFATVTFRQPQPTLSYQQTATPTAYRAATEV